MKGRHTKDTFLTFLLKSTRPLPYTKQTPPEERRKFIKHLHEQGVTIAEIVKIYPTTNYKVVRQIINS